jgi:hypothetical protein
MKKTMLTVVLMGVLVVGPTLQSDARWPKPPEPDDVAVAALAFLGGVIVGNGGIYPRPVYQEGVYISEPPPSGHYELREQQSWVPGYWEMVVDRGGRQARIWHEGFYQTQMVKVWVDYYTPRGGGTVIIDGPRWDGYYRGDGRKGDWDGKDYRGDDRKGHWDGKEYRGDDRKDDRGGKDYRGDDGKGDRGGKDYRSNDEKGDKGDKGGKDDRGHDRE